MRGAPKLAGQKPSFAAATAPVRCAGFGGRGCAQARNHARSGAPDRRLALPPLACRQAASCAARTAMTRVPARHGTCHEHRYSSSAGRIDGNGQSPGDADHRKRSTKITACTTACRASCGRLWPMPVPISLCSYLPETDVPPSALATAANGTRSSADTSASCRQAAMRLRRAYRRPPILR